MMYAAQFKISQFELNLNYPINYYHITMEEYTNQLVNKRMNEFNQLFQDAGYKYFILDYKDDLLSLICYRMLKNLQSACPFEFDILIYGKIWHTRKEIQNKPAHISTRKLNTLIKNNECVIVQGSNLLYNVVKSKTTYKDFPCTIWSPIYDFIPRQVETLQIFYHIGYLKKDLIQFNNPKVKAFSNFCEGEDLNFDFPSTPIYSGSTIGLVKIINDKETDMKTLNEVEKYSKGLLFYFTDIDSYKTILRSEYSFFVENKANIPDKYNVNNEYVAKDICRLVKKELEFFGPWTEEEKEEWNESCNC